MGRDRTDANRSVLPMRNMQLASQTLQAVDLKRPEHEMYAIDPHSLGKCYDGDRAALGPSATRGGSGPFVSSSINLHRSF